MKSAGLKLVLVAALLGASISPSPFALAADPLSDLSEVKARLTAIEERQKEILDKEDKILAELDRIRIWVHRK
ncbi:MAG: hypothetical protein V1882_00070 [Candidatus Omnitrophota bacterium]